MTDGREIEESSITITDEDGFHPGAFAARPKTGSKGGLVILQEIFGVTGQRKSVARSYALDGLDNGHDEHAARSDKAVRAAIADAESHVYDAGHAFANDARKTYVAEAAEAARMRSLAFLDKRHATGAAA